MNTLQLLRDLYNTRSVGRLFILTELDKPEELFDFSKPIIMDDLSYIYEGDKYVQNSQSKPLFKKEFMCKIVQRYPLKFEFTSNGVVYTNRAACFKSNI